MTEHRRLHINVKHHVLSKISVPASGYQNAYIFFYMVWFYMIVNEALGTYRGTYVLITLLGNICGSLGAKK